MIDPCDLRLRVSLRQLEVFVATVREGTTRGAAERIARSQSAASAALAELESTFGVQLFDRTGRRLRLNENGRMLLPHAHALLSQAAALETMLSGVYAAPLCVAASFTIGEYLLPRLIADWTRAHPSSRVRLSIANTSDVIDAVVRFEADVGFIEGAQSHPDLIVQPWCSDELVIVAAPSHPFVASAPTQEQLADAVWVLREPESGTRQATDSWLLAHVDQLNVGFELGSTEAIKRLVAAGAGLGCLSRQAIAHALHEGWLAEVKTALPKASRQLALVVHRDKRPGRVTAQFMAHCLGESRSVDSTSAR